MREPRDYVDGDESLLGPSPAFFPRGAELEARVRSGRFNREAPADRKLMQEAGFERSGQFLAASQGRGKPMTYGSGKPPEEK